jgi:hypothetical protein
VLQAVHLLLAFPLFVVVVAVDSRWLLHSLRQQAEVFRSEDKSLEAERWRATPLNYLEKIFHIPFSLQPMQSDGFGNLIKDLTKSKETPDLPKPPPDDPSVVGRTVEPRAGNQEMTGDGVKPNPGEASSKRKEDDSRQTSRTSPISLSRPKIWR